MKKDVGRKDIKNFKKDDLLNFERDMGLRQIKTC